MRSRRSNSIVPPPRHGTPTRLRNCAISSPAKATALTTSTTPGVTGPSPFTYGAKLADSTTRAAAEAA
jgi:hypothetical protein